MHCYRSYTPRITLCGAIVTGVMSRKEAGEKILLFPSNSGRFLKGSSKVDKKNSADDIVRFLTHFSVSRAIKDSVMEAGPLGRPQRPRPAKELESASTMLYKWLLKEANPVLWRQAKLPLRGKNGFSQGLRQKNLLSMARGFAVHLHSRVMSYVASGSEKRAVLL